jgi:hypothetical protein
MSILNTTPSSTTASSSSSSSFLNRAPLSSLTNKFNNKNPNGNIYGPSTMKNLDIQETDDGFDDDDDDVTTASVATNSAFNDEKSELIETSHQTVTTTKSSKLEKTNGQTNFLASLKNKLNTSNSNTRKYELIEKMSSTKTLLPPSQVEINNFNDQRTTILTPILVVPTSHSVNSLSSHRRRPIRHRY